MPIDGDKFTMPNSNVTVRAIFEKDSATPGTSTDPTPTPTPTPVPVPMPGIPGIPAIAVVADADTIKAREDANSAIKATVEGEKFNEAENKTAEEIMKEAAALIEKETDKELIKKIEAETIAKIDALWNKAELEEKAKVESVGSKEFKLKTKKLKKKRSC